MSTRFYVALCIGFTLVACKAYANTEYVEKDLIYAAKDCNIPKMQEILNQGDIDVDGGYYFDKNPLMYAAKCESSKPVEFLIKNGAKLNMLGSNDNGKPFAMTAIMYAIDCGKCIESLKILISAGADLNLSTRHTALTFAAAESRIPEAMLLVQKGANLNLRSTWLHGKTPLMLAIESRSTALAKLLIDKGADLNLKEENQSFSALHLAVNNRFFYPELDEIAKYLILKKANLNIEDEDGNTPLFWSRSKGQTIFYELVRNGADIHHRNKLGETVLMLNTPLDHFWSLEDLELYKWILSEGVNPDLLSLKDGMTALMLASWSGNEVAVEILLSGKANPNLRNPAGKTALTICKESSYIHDEAKRNKIIELLVKNGASE